jgi:hypothetical protein
LKENVIIGKLIPAGTGFQHDRFNRIDAFLAKNKLSVSNLPGGD